MSTGIGSSQSAAAEYVVLYGVPTDTYRHILDALGEYHLRHTYDRGTLEMRRLVYGVSAEDYRKLLHALGDYRLRHTYYQGTLEIMSPRKDHDWIAELLGTMIRLMGLTLKIRMQSMGSTTLTTAAIDHGLQPDKAYYIAHEPLVRGKDTYEPDHDPPPDLVIEIDITSSSVSRLPLFAKLGVPEIWRYAGNELQFLRLTSSGTYEPTARSIAFPFLAPENVTHFLNQRESTDEDWVIQAFVEWAQQTYDDFKSNPKDQP